MKLDNSSFLGRTLRRFGRVGIALFSVVAFVAGGALVYFTTALTMGVWFPKLTLLAAFGAAIGVYRFFDKLDMIPEDPDKLITLSLTENSMNNSASQAWISSDRTS